MSERSAFVRAWHAWRHVPLPVADFLARRLSTPAHDVQLVLDHLASSIFASGMGAMEGRAWDFVAICERHRESLREADGRLETLAADARQPYRTWMDRSRTCWMPLPPGTVQRRPHPRNPE
jgi:hypothetical protein